MGGRVGSERRVDEDEVTGDGAAGRSAKDCFAK